MEEVREMTRETKLGLLVASSFVALTAVVVVARIKQKGESPPETTPPGVRTGVQPPPPKDLPPVPAPGTAPPNLIPAAAFSNAIPIQGDPTSGRIDGAGQGLPAPAVTPAPTDPRPVPTSTSGLPDVNSLPGMGTAVVQNTANPTPVAPAVPAPVNPQPAPVVTDPAKPMPAPAQPLTDPTRPAAPTAAAPMPMPAPVPAAQVPAAVAPLPTAPAPSPAPGKVAPVSLPVTPATPDSAAKKDGKEQADPLARPLPNAAPVPAAPLPAAPVTILEGNKAPSSPAPVAPLPAGPQPGKVDPLQPAPTSFGAPADGKPAAAQPLSNAMPAPVSAPNPAPLPGALAAPANPAAPTVSMPSPAALGVKDPAPAPAKELLPVGDKEPAPKPAAVSPQSQGQLSPAADPLAPPPVRLVTGPKSEGDPLANLKPVPVAVAQADPVRPVPASTGPDPKSMPTSANLNPAPVPDQAGTLKPAAAPPLGTPANIGSPPIAVPNPPETPKPTVGTKPVVKFIDVQTYACKPEDTSFAALSKRFYGSERYGQALLQYNRDHPLVTESVKADPPRLRPGVDVYVPPLEILETRYRNALPADLPAVQDVPARSALPTGPATPVARSAPVSESVAVAVPVVAPGVIPAKAQAAPTNGTKVYRVQAAQGEAMYMIARKTLGDAARWNEIYRLNPQLIPEQPVPVGTPVVLPGDARVDQ
jgi:Meckel syndrome type 1 protein